MYFKLITHKGPACVKDNNQSKNKTSKHTVDIAELNVKKYGDLILISSVALSAKAIIVRIGLRTILKDRVVWEYVAWKKYNVYGYYASMREVCL